MAAPVLNSIKDNQGQRPERFLWAGILGILGKGEFWGQHMQLSQETAYSGSGLKTQKGVSLLLRAKVWRV